MKAIIVEDEVTSREILRQMIEEYCVGVSVIAEAADVEEAVQLIRQHQPNLVFLDIELPQENGFELFNYFDPIPFGVIFTTAYDEYAIKALRLSAIDYLLKPIDIDELQNAINKANSTNLKLKNQQLKILAENFTGAEPKIGVATINGYLFLKVKNILSCKAEGKYTVFAMADGSSYMTSKNIGEYEAVLKAYGFLRIHRSQIINISKVQEYIRGKSPMVVLEDGTRAQVAQSKKDALLMALGLI